MDLNFKHTRIHIKETNKMYKVNIPFKKHNMEKILKTLETRIRRLELQGKLCAPLDAPGQQILPKRKTSKSDFSSTTLSEKIVLNLDIDQCTLPSEDSGDLLWTVQKFWTLLKKAVNSNIDELYELTKIVTKELVNEHLINLLQAVQERYGKDNVIIKLCTAKSDMVSAAKPAFVKTIHHTTMYCDQHPHASFKAAAETNILHIPGLMTSDEVKNIFFPGSYNNAIRMLVVADAIQVIFFHFW